MIKNLVLDIGNVICEWNPERLSASVSEDPEVRAAVWDGTIKHPDWLDLDRGVISVEDAIENAHRRTQLDRPIVGAIYKNLPPSMYIIDATVAAMHRAHEAGVPIYILSNMQHHAWEYLEKNHACFSLCTGVVVSCEVGLIKPEPEIYQHLCERFSLQPSECIFVDDMLENVEAARACGWHAEQLARIEDSELVLNQVVDKIIPKSQR